MGIGPENRLPTFQRPVGNCYPETILPLRFQATALYYEWQKTGCKSKQPYFIRPRGGGMFAFAGLWERWNDPKGQPVESCTILTTAANELMRPIHDRMPLILNQSVEDVWLDPRSSVDALRSLFVPFLNEQMEAFPVNPWVSNARNQGPRCLESA